MLPTQLEPNLLLNINGKVSQNVKHYSYHMTQQVHSYIPKKSVIIRLLKNSHMMLIVVFIIVKKYKLHKFSTTDE